jgi:hypothetical protein
MANLRRRGFQVPPAGIVIFGNFSVPRHIPALFEPFAFAGGFTLNVPDKKYVFVSFGVMVQAPAPTNQIPRLPSLSLPPENVVARSRTLENGGRESHWGLGAPPLKPMPTGSGPLPTALANSHFSPFVKSQ